MQDKGIHYIFAYNLVVMQVIIELAKRAFVSLIPINKRFFGEMWFFRNH